MGFEYQARLTSPAQVSLIDEITSVVLASTDWLLVERGSGWASLRRPESNRPEWPEDARIVLQDGGVYVLLNCNGNERQELLKALEAALQACGHAVEFEDL